MIPPKSQLDQQSRQRSAPAGDASASDQHGTKDQDSGKGAVEQDEQNQGGNISMEGQLGHRDQDAMIKSADTDFPEPGGNPEHSGERERKKA
ncbi:MAG: hypothetical protein JOY93_04925 [Acidobacteriales bacterium]|nr:hypothetical protein [Terriglobales bacterium]